jgi:hypothetical protein
LPGKRASLAFLVASSEYDEKTASGNAEVERTKRPGLDFLLFACLFSARKEPEGEVGVDNQSDEFLIVIEIK